VKPLEIVSAKTAGSNFTVIIQSAERDVFMEIARFPTSVTVSMDTLVICVTSTRVSVYTRTTQASAAEMDIVVTLIYVVVNKDGGENNVNMVCSAMVSTKTALKFVLLMECVLA